MPYHWREGVIDTINEQRLERVAFIGLKDIESVDFIVTMCPAAEFFAFDPIDIQQPEEREKFKVRVDEVVKRHAGRLIFHEVAPEEPPVETHFDLGVVHHTLGADEIEKLLTHWFAAVDGFMGPGWDNRTPGVMRGVARLFNLLAVQVGEDGLWAV